MRACAPSPETSAPSSDTCRPLPRDHAAPESTLALPKAGKPWLRPSAASGLVLATQKLGGATGRGTMKKLVLIVIDGLTPAAFERAIEGDRAPALRLLANHGGYTRGVSTFPSVTPVCLSSIATGAHPDVHRIPHLVWYHRDERRIIEYGSSFAAIRAAGTRRSILDAIFNMNEQHLGEEAVTVFEALEDAGYTTAAVNFTCYRGRTRHAPAVPGVGRPAYGPKRFFFYNLFESDVTGAPLAVFGRAAGSIDAYAGAVGRWLVTRDGFDFLVYYLPDYDFASHVAGPEAADEALARSDAAVWALFEAAGGPDEFLDRYAVVLAADHGQTHVDRTVRLDDRFAGAGVIVTASNRAGMVYRTEKTRDDTRSLAARLDGDPGAEAVLFLEGAEAVARRDGEELRFSRSASGWTKSGDGAVLPQPDAIERAWAALHNPHAGDLIVSAGEGVEFADLAGRSHLGGGSHGALAMTDSEVPFLIVGLDAAPRSITDLASVALEHFGVEPPAYARSLAHAA
jgi:predicted AlkP superfamily pyrophosphatase or phosphodiesterase